MKVRVECYSGYKGDERPIRFQIGDQPLTIEEIIDRWYSPRANWFRIRASDGNTYILRQAAPEGGWTLESFRRGS